MAPGENAFDTPGLVNAWYTSPSSSEPHFLYNLTRFTFLHTFYISPEGCESPRDRFLLPYLFLHLQFLKWCLDQCLDLGWCSVHICLVMKGVSWEYRPGACVEVPDPPVGWMTNVS